MRLSRNMLLIVANPFAAPLSTKGEAMALCPVDPHEPMGRSYIGAVTKAATVKQPGGRRPGLGVSVAVGKGRSTTRPLTRDKVSVVYSLAPVTVPDTAYYRQKIKAGEVFAHRDDNFGHGPGMFISDEECRTALRAAARAALAAFEQRNGSRSNALAAWRAQGLGAVTDMIENRTSGKCPSPTHTEDAGTGPDPGARAGTMTATVAIHGGLS